MSEHISDKRNVRLPNGVFVFFILSGIVLAVVTFVIGYWIGAGNTDGQTRADRQVLNIGSLPSFLSNDIDFELFWDTWKEIQHRSVSENVNDADLYYGAMKGLVNALEDPYSVFFNPEEAEAFSDMINGSFEGIGCELGVKDGLPVVIAPLPNTPAEKAGLRPGDAIVAVDEEDVSLLPLDEIVSKIRGEAGTTVTLTVIPKRALDSNIRSGMEVKDVPIVRGNIVIETVEVEDSGMSGIGYVKIASFNADTASDFKKALETVLSGDPRGLVVDLRNNPGGYLGAAVDIAGYWVKNDVVVTEQGRAPEFPIATQFGSGILSRMPTVVLVNGGSASASEILAGALRDYDMATIVGEQTYGKGTVQDLVTLPDDSLLKLTVAKWYTPDGTSIENEGIAPDIEVAFEEPESWKDGDIVPLEPEEDNQLRRALELFE